MHQKWSIHQAEMADLPALVAMEEQRFDTDRISARSFRRWLRLGHQGLGVARQDDALIGYVLLLRRRNSAVARLYSIAVAQAASGKGLGDALLDWAEDRAQDWGARRIRLEVAPQNLAALSLYERRGYMLLEKLPGYYENGGDALRLERSLDKYWQA